MTASAWLVDGASLLCAGVMGFAIQRGATCTVAAVDELLNQRSAYRLAAMLEASLWVAGGLALAQLAHVAGSMPLGHVTSAWTVLGGALLGLGAWINGGCVFGAVARLGSGDWACAATPVGYYLGCATAGPVLALQAGGRLGTGSPLFEVATPVALAFVAHAAWRIGPGVAALRSPGRGDWLRRTVWQPHAATIVIGLSFVSLMLLAGRWTYTDVLADLALAMGPAPTAGVRAWPVLLLIALYAGALVGGHTAGRWRPTLPAPGALGRCLVGGLVMAWGSLLIPGSNDGLILIGLPLLHLHAWVAFASMVVTIALAMGVHRAGGRRQARERARWRA